jgi:hypothetical protein
MKNKPATDAALGALHEALATVIASQVKATMQEFDEEGNVIEGAETYSATPALLTVAARFLKDNNITCTVEDSKGLSSLTDELAERKKRRGNISNISFLTKEEASG